MYRNDTTSTSGCAFCLKYLLRWTATQTIQIKTKQNLVKMLDLDQEKMNQGNPVQLPIQALSLLGVLEGIFQSNLLGGRVAISQLKLVLASQHFAALY